MIIQGYHLVIQTKINKWISHNEKYMNNNKKKKVHLE